MDSDSDLTLNTLRNTILSGKNIESARAMYNRAQNIKRMLRSEIKYDEKIKNQLNKSALNKILVVTHNEVMLALTAKSVTYDPS